MAADAVTIGRELNKARKIVPEGEWHAWLRDNFQWSIRTATTLMRVHDMAERLGSEKFSDLPIAQSALYLMARDDMPQSALDELITMAKAGKPVSHALAKQKIAEARKKSKPTPAPAAKFFDAPEPEIDDERLDIYERARAVLDELKPALPPSAYDSDGLVDDDSEMYQAIEALEWHISNAYWEVVTGAPPTDESVRLPKKPAE